MRLVAVPALTRDAAPRPPGSSSVHCHIGGESMGTTWRVEFYSSNPSQAGEVKRSVEQVLILVVDQMSHYQHDSDLSRFNRSRGGRWVDLPTALYRVLEAALSVARESGGAFDPTLGRLVNAWGFGPGTPRNAPPPDAEIGDALARRGWDRLLLDSRRRRAWQPGGVMLDLSSIAKGFAVDETARLLDEAGIASYLVEAGGEFRSRGLKPDGQPWWIAIEPPPETETLPEVVIALCGQSVATSGDYRRYFEHGGVRYPHTLDARTGAPILHALESVTVVHDVCMLADAYSTAILALGVQPGLQLAGKLGLAALLVARTETGPRHYCTSAFQAMLD